jgi:predicted transcriptional regulator
MSNLIKFPLQTLEEMIEELEECNQAMNIISHSYKEFNQDFYELLHRMDQLTRKIDERIQTEPTDQS